MEIQEAINVMPRIGDVAPDFDAVTTKGKIQIPGTEKNTKANNTMSTPGNQENRLID